MRVILMLSLLTFAVMAQAQSEGENDSTDGDINPPALERLLNAESDSDESEEKTSKRIEHLEEEAMSQGVRAGYLDQLTYLIEAIEQKKTEMDRLYDFNALMRFSNHGAPVSNVLPPVIEEAEDRVEIGSGYETMQVSGTLYRILQPARLASHAPLWQTYLLAKPTAKNELIPSLLPRTTEEQEAWQKNVLAGWTEGQRQANREMSYRVRRLARDYNGMVRYLTLYRENKVSAPFVAYSKQAVDGNEEAMSVDNTFYRITAPAQLNHHTETWIPSPEDDET